jgi:prolyl-tRNA synthetase
MRLSRLLGRTLRQPPSDAHLSSHQLLTRAGYVRGLEAGLFAYLPLGRRVLSHLRTLVRQELTSIGGQEVQIPLPPDSEPLGTLVHLARREIDSYRQLPVLLFEFASTILPQPGTRAGLFGASQRPFVKIRVLGDEDLAAASEVKSAVKRVLAACELETVWAERNEEGQQAYVLHASGDAELVRCPTCGYVGERSWTQIRWPDSPEGPELPPEEIATPGCDTIASLAEFLDIPTAQTLKMVFYSVEGRVTCIVIRGDRAVDEDKLARVLGTDQYYSSLEHELASIGAVGGYASPIGLDKSKVRVVADPSIRVGRNFVSGANRADYHIQNVNTPRDFVPGDWADLALVEPGDPCPTCNSALEMATGFSLVHTSPSMPCNPDAEYQDEQGESQRLWVMSYRLDLGRIMAAIVEQHHDDYGIIWPGPCAPFDVHLVALDLRRDEVATQAEALYDRLQEQGYSVLFDDRSASAGVKFNDADLFGVCLRLTVSKRSVKEGLVEAKWRDSRERLKLDEDGLATELARLGD